MHPHFETYIIAMLAVSYLVQSWYIGKLLRDKKQSTELNKEMAKQHTNMLLMQAERQLAEAMLEQNVASLQSTKDLCESVQILADRVATYNERLNNLTLSVKLDKTSTHM